jgi:2-keto-3-deoxy-galactonokinase
MSWPSPLEWLGIIGTLATLTSLVLAWGARDTKKILARMDGANRAYHETSQGMLERMDRGTKEILERMDRQAEARYRDLKDRLDGAEGQP